MRQMNRLPLLRYFGKCQLPGCHVDPVAAMVSMSWGFMSGIFGNQLVIQKELRALSYRHSNAVSLSIFQVDRSNAPCSPMDSWM